MLWCHAMTLEERLRQEFAEDTAYERLLLATIIDPSKPPPGTVFATNDIRGTGPRSFRRCLGHLTDVSGVRNYL